MVSSCQYFFIAIITVDSGVVNRKQCLFVDAPEKIIDGWRGHCFQQFRANKIIVWSNDCYEINV